MNTLVMSPLVSTMVAGYATNGNISPAQGSINIQGKDRGGRLLFSWTINAVGAPNPSAPKWFSSVKFYTIKTPGVVAKVTMKFQFK